MSSLSSLAFFRLARPRQWVKNAFVFAPLFFTPAALNGESLLAVAATFAAFCLVASAAYCLNDYRDREGDRLHPTKRNRPLASGEVAPAHGLILAVVLLVGGVGLCLAFAAPALPALAGYAVLNLLYSLILKRFSIVDVMAIAFGFLLRLHGGAMAIDVDPTPWIQICAGLLALFIALAKRRDDVVRQMDTEHRSSLKGYSKPFLDACLMVVMAVLLVSYLIFTVDAGAMQRLGSDKLIWTAPFVVGGVLRYLQITLVEERSGSPTDLVLSDAPLAIAVIGWLACFAWLIYL